MTDTGWPLIPREVLPAPLPAAKRRLSPRSSHPTDPGHQLPFFGAETTEPAPADLAGLLVGPGRLGRMGGTARVSIEVDAAWRVHVLVAELVVRGLTATWRPVDQSRSHHPEVRVDPSPPEGLPPDVFSPDSDPAKRDNPDPVGRSAAPPDADRGTNEPDHDDADQKTADTHEEDRVEPAKPRFEVLTAYSRRLNGLARAWPEAASQLFLSGPRLRLWVVATGEPVAGGYALGLDPAKDPTVIDAALARAGLAGRLPADGRHYLIIGKRRLRRLAELVGNRPAAAPEHLWPGGAGA